MSSIEKIVIDIQNGINRKNELFPLIKGVIYKLCHKYYVAAMDKQYEFDDLISVAWFGVERAIMAYNPEKEYVFITYLTFHIRNVIAEFLGFRGAKHLDVIYLDELVSGAENITIGDTIKDETSDRIFDRIEHNIIGENIWREVDKLPENEKHILERYYKESKSYTAIAEELGVSIERVRQIKRKGMHRLRRNPKIRNCYYEDFAYRRITQSTFNCTWTSSTEWAAIKIMQLKAD